MDRRTIDHLARLARLGLQDSDRSRYEGQLAAILRHFEQLGELDLRDVAPIADAGRDAGRARADEPRADADGVDLVDHAADRDGRSFRMPRVLE